MFHLDPGGNRPTANLEGRAQQAPHPGEPGRKAALQLVDICALDPLRDVVEREDAEEVHVDRRPAFLRSRFLSHPRQQRGLAVPARRHQAAVVAADRTIQQLRCLLVAVEQLVGRDGLAVAEWVSALVRRAGSLAAIEQVVTGLPDPSVGGRQPGEHREVAHVGGQQIDVEQERGGGDQVVGVVDAAV